MVIPDSKIEQQVGGATLLTNVLIARTRTEGQTEGLCFNHYEMIKD